MSNCSYIYMLLVGLGISPAQCLQHIEMIMIMIIMAVMLMTLGAWSDPGAQGKLKRTLGQSPRQEHRAHGMRLEIFGNIKLSSQLYSG